MQFIWPLQMLVKILNKPLRSSADQNILRREIESLVLSPRPSKEPCKRVTEQIRERGRILTQGYLERRRG
jgi:hypothetical protein